MRYAQTCGIVLILSSCVALSVHAQEPKSRDERELAGHHFIPSGRLPDPFVTTHARFRTAGGLAVGFQSIYKVPGEDSIRVTEGDVGFFGLDFEYQQNLFERASARMSLEGNARVGVDGESILASGLSSTYGLELEGKYRFLRRERFLLTGHAIFSRKNLFGLTPLRWAEDILENGYDKDDKLLAEGQLSRVVFGPGAAWAPRPGLGFTGHVLVGPADPFESGTPDDTAFRYGVTADVDLKEFAWFPIGLMGGYDYDSLPEVDNELVEGVHSGTFQIAYTGRDDFSIGLEITYGDIKQRDFPDEFSSTLFSINSRYYF
jgi:hypothetical protein